jgi:hypothetical protein
MTAACCVAAFAGVSALVAAQERPAGLLQYLNDPRVQEALKSMTPEDRGKIEKAFGSRDSPVQSRPEELGNKGNSYGGVAGSIGTELLSSTQSQVLLENQRAQVAAYQQRVQLLEVELAELRAQVDSLTKGCKK